MPWWNAIGGILVAFVLSKFFNLELIYYNLLLAIGFAFLPDIDLAIWLKKHNWKVDKWTHEHRDILHYPIPYLSLGTTVIWLLANQFYAFLFLFCSLPHFLHDSVGIGWGIKWLWPFSKRNFKFLAYKHAGEKRRFLTSWTPEELKAEVLKRG